MLLECPHCQNALTVPDRLRRYYDMPVRCQKCRHILAIQKQGPRDDRGPAHDFRRPLDRSASARYSHHMIVCQGCGMDLRGQGQCAPLRLSCPFCLADILHHRSGGAARLDRVTIVLLVGIVAGCAVLWSHHEGYIELRNLLDGALIVDGARQISDEWLARLRQMLTDLFTQLRTAAMARLV